LPLVVLFGEHGADEADHGVAVGQDADHVGNEALAGAYRELDAVRADRRRAGRE
jgi:hypothetical protein